MVTLRSDDSGVRVGADGASLLVLDGRVGAQAFIHWPT
jgi:hypothetical protein